MRLIYSFFLIAILICSCNNSKRIIPSRNFWEVDTLLGPNDRILSDTANHSVFEKFNAKANKIYVGQYEHGKLEGQIEIYNSGVFPSIIGHMKENQPNGLWFFIDRYQKIDSVTLILNGQNEIINKAIFHYDTVTISASGDRFKIRKPKPWGFIQDALDLNKGIIEEVRSDRSIKAHVILYVDSFAVPKIDFPSAIKYIQNGLKRVYTSMAILNQKYFTNTLGTYYQMHADAFAGEKKFVVVSSIFINGNKMYTLLGLAENKSTRDFYVYDWLLKDIMFSFSK